MYVFTENWRKLSQNGHQISLLNKLSPARTVTQYSVSFYFHLFVLRFYGLVNPMGSCRARSVYLTTHLLGRLSPLSGKPVLCTFFRQKLTTALLESVEWKENFIFMKQLWNLVRTVRETILTDTTICLHRGTRKYTVSSRRHLKFSHAVLFNIACYGQIQHKTNIFCLCFPENNICYFILLSPIKFFISYYCL